jgi:hypothetical protein
MRLEYLDMIDRGAVPDKYFKNTRLLTSLLDTLGKLDDMASDVAAGTMPPLDANTLYGLMIEAAMLKEIEPLIKDFYDRRKRFHGGEEE